MAELNFASAGNLDSVQAAELALLVELEARWENLRHTRPPSPDRHALEARQKAYEAFHTKLVAYNKRYKPAHVPELLLNTPLRLGAWCRTMRDLHHQLDQSAKTHCPTHLVEKAYRWADQIGTRFNKDRIVRTPLPASIAAAVESLEAVGRWCDDLAGVTSAA